MVSKKSLKWKSDSYGKKLAGPNGFIVKDQWITWGNKSYYLKPNGYMAAEEWYDGQWFDKKGGSSYKYKGKWIISENGDRYRDSSGWYAKNTKMWIDGALYSFNAKGYVIWGDW